MKPARLPLVIIGAVALVLGLSACEKPNPGASVFSGTSTEFQRAACWSEGPEYLTEASCAADALAQVTKDATPVPTLAGQTIGISVDPVVADAGWFPVLGDTRLTSAPITSTYFRFTPTQEQLAAGDTTLAVIAGDDKGTRGVWVFPLAAA